jgi:hypothetical protein
MFAVEAQLSHGPSFDANKADSVFNDNDQFASIAERIATSRIRVERRNFKQPMTAEIKSRAFVRAARGSNP